MGSSAKNYLKKLLCHQLFIVIILINFVSNSSLIDNNQVCGRKRAVGVSNIPNNNNATHSDYPWHVAVYDATKTFICSGSLISAKIVLSAAYCFTDFDGEVLPKENYYIAGGKYYSNYDDKRDRNAQYSEINAIHVPNLYRYRGLVNYYGSDIAAVILSTPFLISTNIQPVCIDLESDYDELNDTTLGIVTGWDGVNEPSTEGLIDLFVTYIPHDKCFEEMPKPIRKYITYDKICGGSLDNATSICKIGSGAQLIFPKIVQSNEQYYIRGVASVFNPCNQTENVYEIFTSVANHIEFIREIITINGTME